jgi:hypothetical protein
LLFGIVEILFNINGDVAGTQLGDGSLNGSMENIPLILMSNFSPSQFDS